MRLHRFYITETIGNQTESAIRSKGLADQIKKVLRLKAGDEVILFDASGSDYIAAVGRFIGTDQIVFDIHSHSPSRSMPSRKVYLCAALIKKDSFEFIVEKATELGVTDIVPVIAERSEKKALNEERLIKISIEASEQSGRGDVPTIHSVISLKEAIDSVKKQEEGSKKKGGDLKLIAFHTEGESFNLNDLSKEGPIALFIGPEGGWSPEEIGLFHKNGVEIRCLGSLILRAETAVVAALSKVCL